MDRSDYFVFMWLSALFIYLLVISNVVPSDMQFLLAMIGTSTIIFVGSCVGIWLKMRRFTSKDLVLSISLVGLSIIGVWAVHHISIVFSEKVAAIICLVLIVTGLIFDVISERRRKHG